MSRHFKLCTISIQDPCADPERFDRGDPTPLTDNMILVDKGRGDPITTKTQLMGDAKTAANVIQILKTENR